MREVLLYFFNINRIAAEAHELLVEAYGANALSATRCNVWYNRFQNGEYGVADLPRPDRPSVLTDSDFIEMVEDDPRKKAGELGAELGAGTTVTWTRLKSLGSCFRMLLLGNLIYAIFA